MDDLRLTAKRMAHYTTFYPLFGISSQPNKRLGFWFHRLPCSIRAPYSPLGQSVSRALPGWLLALTLCGNHTFRQGR